jgi:hypothetical protein
MDTKTLADTQVCFRVPPGYAPCTALERPPDNAAHIFDTEHCKTLMTLSDHEGKQIIRDNIQKCFLQDIRTMFIYNVFPDSAFVSGYQNHHSLIQPDKNTHISSQVNSQAKETRMENWT